VINRDRVLQDVYDGLSKLGFADLVLVQAQLGEHLWNLWQHGALRREKMAEKEVVKSH
jgi:hypothetical protein